MTNFYKVYRRYTHFSQESITIPMDGPNEMSLDVPIRIRAKIPRHADLLTDLAFVFRVPELYSKIWEEQEQRIPSIRWIHMLGPMIIDNVALYIGGAKIQEFPGEWMAVRASVDYPADKYLKWRNMVGDVSELHSPEWGIYGKSPNYPYQKGEYPHTIPDDDGVATAPSTPEREIRVPLPFWFTESWGAALPLVALQMHEVEVQITLRTLREIYRIMDDEFQAEPVKFGRRLVPDGTKPATEDNLTLQNKYESWDDPSGNLRYFYTDAGSAPALQDGFIMNAHLEGNYIYLTERERESFASRELRHLVHQVQVFRFYDIVHRTKLDMDIHGLVQRILFFGRRSDAIESRNDYINLSNWKSLTQAPYWPITGPLPPGITTSSGRLIPYTQRDILQTARVVIAGNEIFEEKPAQYFEVQNPFATTTGGGIAGINPGGIKPDDIMGPIYQIPFCLNASDHEQPTGSLNTSRLREIQLEVHPWALDPQSDYAYDFTVYVENINTVTFTNGMAGLSYAV